MTEMQHVTNVIWNFAKISDDTNADQGCRTFLYPYRGDRDRII